MKNSLPVLLLCALALGSCKKDKDDVNGGSTPVNFITTEYSYLGEYDEQGRPKYLVASDVITSKLLNFVKSSLPEYADIRNTHPEYLKNADIAITSKSDVFITFVAEGSGYTNSVGYYLYKTGSSPKKARGH